MVRASSKLTLVLLLGTSACVGTRELPEIPKQVKVPYGPKIYLADNTVAIEPTGKLCTRFGKVRVGTTTVTESPIEATNGGMPIPANEPHNCYVEVKQKAPLQVDAVEVTNELFQLCVDSGACTTPDPSKANKGQLCEAEEGFDTCPAVEITHTAATTFCAWIGRRLPSAIEHVLMRQGMNRTTPEDLPIYPTGGRDETKKPDGCSESVLGLLGCKRPAPSDPKGPEGGASNDVVVGAEGERIFDLMGNVSEWASDLLPEKRGTATGLPWFCAGRLPTPPEGAPPTCPEGAICVRGQYQPAGQRLGDYPVCIAFGAPLRSMGGAHGALFGGNFLDQMFDRAHEGIFARRVELAPDDKAPQSYGFRCVGDLDVDDALEAQPHTP